jgi:hypothetical protein
MPDQFRRLELFSLPGAGVPPAIMVTINLIGIGMERTIIDITADAIMITVIEWIIRAGIATIPPGIPISIILVRIGAARAVINIATSAIVILIIVEIMGTGITAIADLVTILIILIGIGTLRTIILIATPKITILIVGTVENTAITGIADAILIQIFLTEIRDIGAIVCLARIHRKIGITKTIVVGIGAKITGITAPIIEFTGLPTKLAIAVPVLLIGVGGHGTVVGRVADAIIVGIHPGAARCLHRQEQEPNKQKFKQ